MTDDGAHGAFGRFRLDGKVAVVTGGSRGIGLALAGGFVEAGASVVLASRDRVRCEEAAHALGGDALGFACDVAAPDDVTALFERVAQVRGGTDIFVHCAGLAGGAFATNVTSGDLQQMLDVHYLGGVRAAQCAATQMRERGGGAVLLVTSLWGLVGRTATLAYGGAKAALAHAVKVLAIEWARDGIRVNGLAPGLVETDMTAGLSDRQRERMLARIPFGRAARPQEMVGPALLLCSDGGGYVTGQVLVVDGGEHAYG